MKKRKEPQYKPCSNKTNIRKKFLFFFFQKQARGGALHHKFVQWLDSWNLQSFCTTRYNVEPGQLGALTYSFVSRGSWFQNLESRLNKMQINSTSNNLVSTSSNKQLGSSISATKWLNLKQPVVKMFSILKNATLRTRLVKLTSRFTSPARSSSLRVAINERTVDMAWRENEIQVTAEHTS